MTKNTTIAAIATPPGCGGVGIIRVSGEQARLVAQKIIRKKLITRKVHYAHFYAEDGHIIDHGIALFFEGPHSFTGEDILELQGHGGTIVLDNLLKEILKIDDVELAKPGEFSRRAFLNGKIDLVQAEAIADLIDASSSQAARLAMKSLQGEFSNKIHELVDLLTHLRMYVESDIDFPEDEIDFLNSHKISDQLNHLIKKLDQVFQSAKQGVIRREGITVAIAGQPNVGKSSLLNRLTGEETAIVTEIAGTTRDVLKELIQIDGLPIHIIDTAGLRETKNLVEKEGIKRAWSEIEKADAILLVLDDTQSHSQNSDILGKIPSKPTIIVRNKIDLAKKEAKRQQKEQTTTIYLSAKTGEGIDLLKQQLKKLADFHEGEAQFIARRRHLESLKKAQKLLFASKQQLSNQTFELMAEDLRQAQNALSEITGEFTVDDLLDKIFCEFCIGK